MILYGHKGTFFKVDAIELRLLLLTGGLEVSFSIYKTK